MKAQATFDSNGSGRWSQSSTWTLTSGSDADGIPDSNDDVTILSADNVEIRNDQAANNLIVAGILDFSRNRTLTLGGNLSSSGTAAQITGGGNKVLLVGGNFNVGSGTAIDIVIDDLSISGTTTIDGSVNFLQSAHDIIFNDINVSSTGTWNNNSTGDPIINGNVIVDGAFTGCSTLLACDYFMNSSSGSISGSGTMSVPDLVINSPASYTNTGNVAITSSLTGTGTFTNGVSGFFELQESSDVTITTFNATATGNTVSYNVDVINDLVSSTSNTFYNLVLDNVSSADHLDLQAQTTINNQLTVTTGNLRLGNNTLVIADGATMSGGSINGYIELDGTGVLRQNYSTAGASLFFPIGENTDYTPINSFTINSATFGGGAYLEFSITDAAHPNRDTGNTGSGGDDSGTTASSYISRYWTVSANNITSPDYDATYTYLDADIVGTESDMIGTVYRTPPGQAFLDWSNSGSVNAVNNQASVSNVDAFGDLYAMDNTLDRLPVDLISFEAIGLIDMVKLNWTTASEENNSFFSVERSVDGTHFIEIGQVAGNGTVEGVVIYSFDDNFPLTGRSFYRLRQVDFNGQFEYSEVVSVVWSASERNQVLLYPNPVNIGEVISVKISDRGVNNSDWVLLNISGQKMLSGQTNGDNIIEISTESLSPGIYLFRLDQGTFQTTKKVVIR